MTETETGERWCSQHRQPRSACRPEDRHIQPLRASDELMRKVAAKAAASGFPDRNAGVVAAMEAWVAGTAEPPAARAEAPAPVRRGNHGPPVRKDFPEPALQPLGKSRKAPPVAADDLAETVARLQRQVDGLMARNDSPNRDDSLERARRRAAVAAPVTAPGTAVFLAPDPDAEPVITYPAPEVPDHSRKQGRR